MNVKQLTFSFFRPDENTLRNSPLYARWWCECAFPATKCNRNVFVSYDRGHFYDIKAEYETKRVAVVSAYCNEPIPASWELLEDNQTFLLYDVR
jgi:hypothetical protein